jgi:class 3 adenylate cyclase
VPPSRAKPSDELVNLTTRVYEAIRTADVETLGNLMSEDPCYREFGTDGDEFWQSRQDSLRVVARQFEEAGGFDLRPAMVVAWSEGTIGWSVGLVEEPANPKAPQMRTTMVFRLEAGQWKIVHMHPSYGVSNEETVGVALTTSLDALAAYADEVRPDLGSATSSEGTVTIVFTDIERSSEVAEQLGDQQWLDLLHWHNGVIESQAHRFDGMVVKSQGDGFMLAFSSASGALDFATAVQRLIADDYKGRTVRVRMGINTGDAIRDRDDFFGRAVIVASRVAAHAHGGQVLATELVAGLVAGVYRFRFGDPEPAELRGLSGTYHVRPLLNSRGELSDP